MWSNDYAGVHIPAECASTIGGVAAFILLAALPLAVLLTWLTVVLYRRRVLQAMRSVSPQADTAETTAGSSVTVQPPAAALHFNIGQAADAPAQLSSPATAGLAWRAGVAYTIAGCAHASIATLLTFVFADMELLPVRLLAVWLLYAWPVIPALLLTSVEDPRQKWGLMAAYFGVILALDWSLSAFGIRDTGAGTGSLLIVWLTWMGPPSLLLWVLNNRAWRSVGLPAYLVAIALVAGWLLATQGLACLAIALDDVGIWLRYRYTVLAAMLVLLFSGVWWFLQRTARRYREKRMSSLSFTLDSWWLVVTLADMVIQFDTTHGASASFILAYLLYKWLSRALQPSSEPGARPAELLLLRVFGHRQRSRHLLDQLGQRWNFSGPISLIAAPDLAATNLEPDELLQFWRLRLRSLFVASAADLRQRLESFDASPDPDGRYRVNEFFCYDNTWRATVHALIQRSDAILMDLRGFGEEHRGCQFELGLLLAQAPLPSIVLLVDGSTKLDLLTNLLAKLWRQLPLDSANRQLEQPCIRLFHAPNALYSVTPLLNLLTAASTNPKP
ncbi:hypothetical protein [Thiothrix nivea]|uniref:Uncharacterized protein n=1 Tax=Thiothrix nivea (strain ATCC 35100 / DSM 5205 / JP2) TaxID=870187 RepID=A0A656HCX2_THINJ|nr:hypothetical protein [Thiothrix nivea]EIJ34728.1 hypothetical protein Thini_2161 [Thiothrix nivea DSM 5205]